MHSSHEPRQELDLAPLLQYMERCSPSELVFSDIKIGDGDPLLPHDLNIQRFYVSLPGNVEIEFWMRNEAVEHLQVRQSAMTLMEIEDNGEILPTVNVSLASLPAGQRVRVHALARKYLGEGKRSVATEAQKAILAMAEKVLFPPSRGGYLRNGSRSERALAS